MNQSFLKIVIPIAAIGVAVVFALSILRTNAPTPPVPPTPPATAPAPATTTPVAAARPTPSAAAEHAATAPAATEATTSPATQPLASPTTHPVAVEGFHVEHVDKQELASLGSDQKGSPFKIKAEFTPWGSGIRQISLADYKTEVMNGKPYVVVLPMQAGIYTLFPYAAVAISINGGSRIDIQNVLWRLLPTASPNDVSYRLQILDKHDNPAIQITRTYTLDKDSYDLRCGQRLENLTGEPLQIVWEQNAQGDVPVDSGGIDQRMLVAGYFNLSYNPTRTHVYTDQAYLARITALNALADKQTPFWPNPNLAQTSTELTWFATVNRYFAAVTHPIVHPPTTSGGPWTPDPWFNPQAGTFASLGTLVIGTRDKDPVLDTRRVIFTLTTRPITIAPGAATALDLALYAGPLDDDAFTQPPLAAMDFLKLIVYSRSCTFCTFQPVARALLWLLKGIHFVVRDWGVAIIVLVLLVRLALHPITKRSQISMTKMGKQMQSLQPEIEKLKKKYKDDQQQLNTETMKLYREKGVNPANMLGCLPMVLQMPVWVALYAMLYGAIELRHQPAFYGVFQAVSGGHWAFLADLAAADNFILFNHTFNLPILIRTLPISGINILPVFMAIVYFYQQKLMAVPPANEQAAQQQKMMKWMILLFPIMLYAYPSGLNLYILASTAGGIVDSLIVKQHIKREEEAGTLFPANKTKANKPGGWRERLKESLESKQQAIEERRRREAQNRGRGK